MTSLERWNFSGGMLMKLTHSQLRQLMRVFGHNQSNEGICNGYTWMWIQALFSGYAGVMQFYKRLKFLEHYSGDFSVLKTKIDAIQQDIKEHCSKQESLISYSDHSEFLEILSFCDGIEVYQNPELHEDLFSSPDNTKLIRQNTPAVLSLIISPESLIAQAKQLNTAAPVNVLANVCLMMSPEECTAYFRQLEQWFDANSDYFGRQHIIPLKLGTDNHAVGCSYNLWSKTWQFLDINDEGDEDECEDYVRDLNDLEHLTESLQISFSDNDRLLFHVMPLVMDIKAFPQSSLDELEALNRRHQNLTIERSTMVNDRGASLQYLVSKFGDLDAVIRLAELGADMNAVKMNGSSPLCIACENKEYKIAKVLVQNGAVINHSKSNGDSPLLIAVQAGALDIVQLLLENQAQVNKLNIRGVSPLIAAVQGGNTNIAKLLLVKGAKPNLENQQKVTAFELALASGNLEMIALLIDYGADLNALLSGGSSPLVYAALNSHDNLLQLLLDRGADTCVPDKDGVTPLYWAALMGNAVAVAAILQKSTATLNMPCETNHTPLLVAALSDYTRENLNIFRILLVYGADLGIKNSAGNSALDLALIEDQNPAACKVILSYLHTKNRDYKELLSSSLQERGEIIRYLDGIMAEIILSQSSKNLGIFSSSSNRNSAESESLLHPTIGKNQNEIK